MLDGILAADGDLLVLGAAGSGKTRAVVDLVEAFVARGGDPTRVLAIAATRRSAGTLRDELAVRVARPTSGPLARTIVSLAFEIARGAAIAARRPVPRLRTGAEEDAVIAAALRAEIDEGIDGYWPPALDRAVRQLPAFRSELRAFQTEVVERGAARSLLDSRPEWAASARFLDALAASDPAALDPVRIVAAAAAAVEGGAAADGIAGRLELLVVDDAQELTGSALRLVRALIASGVRVVALGDPDLATGGFRGARPGGFLRLWEGIRPVERFVLPAVHRHGEGIRVVAQRITGRIGTAESGTQRAATASGPGGTAFAVTVPPGSEQSVLIARLLRERRVRSGVPWSQLAVIVRTAASAVAISRELRMLEVPATGAGVVGMRGDEYAVRGILHVLDLALGRTPLDADSARALLTGPVGRLDAIALRRLRATLRHAALAAGVDASADELVVEALRAPGGFALHDSPAARRAAAAAETLHAVARSAEAGGTAEDLLWEAWSRSGLERLWGEAARGAGIAAEEANAHLDAVVALFASAARFVEQSPNAPPQAFLDARERAALEEDSLAPRGRGEAVLVGTPYAFLGREFDTVVLADLQEGVWPDPRVRGTLLAIRELGGAETGIDARREVLHDELRQLASAAGRARELLVAVGSAGDDTGPSPFLRFFPPPPDDFDVDEAALAPLTLRGLVGRLRRTLTRERPGGAAEEAAAAAGLARLAAAGVPGAAPSDWYGLLEPSTSEPVFAPDEEVPVSPSKVGTFQKCPLHWAIERLGGGSTTFATSLGSLVHRAAQDADSADPDAILAAVLERWGELEFEAEWQEEAARASAEEFVRRFVAYERDAAAEGRTVIGRESEFEMRIGRAVVRGSIDRVERMADGTALVVDLKTGREWANDTDAKLAEHPQLSIYQLAIAEHAVPGIDEALAAGGARLVILSRSSSRTDYLAPKQSAMTDEAAERWRQTVASVADGMAASTFVAHVDAHCRDPYAFGPCAIHVIEAVSA